MATSTTPSNDTRVPRRVWYIMGGISLLPLVLMLVFKGFSLVSTAIGMSSITSFDQSEILLLTPEEHKATHTALMKLPLAERKILWLLYQCDPENPAFRPDKNGELPATKTYRLQGMQAFPSQECWEISIDRSMLPIRLAMVTAPSETDKWSEEVRNPHITQDMQLTRRPINNDWENCEMIVDKDPQKIMGCKESFDYSSSVLQFRSKGKGDLKVEVRIIPK